MAIQGRLTAELLRTVRTLVRHLSGVHPKVHLQRSFVQEPPVTKLALELLDAVVDLLMLLQCGAEFEKLSTKLTMQVGLLSVRLATFFLSLFWEFR